MLARFTPCSAGDVMNRKNKACAHRQPWSLIASQRGLVTGSVTQVGAPSAPAPTPPVKERPWPEPAAGLYSAAMKAVTPASAGVVPAGAAARVEPPVGPAQAPLARVDLDTASLAELNGPGLG